MRYLELKKQLPDDISTKIVLGKVVISNPANDWTISVNNKTAGRFQVQGTVPHKIMNIVLTYANTPVKKRGSIYPDYSKKLVKILHKYGSLCNFDMSWSDPSRPYVSVALMYADPVASTCNFTFNARTGLITSASGDFASVPFKETHELISYFVDLLVKYEDHCGFALNSIDRNSDQALYRYDLGHLTNNVIVAMNTHTIEPIKERSAIVNGSLKQLYQAANLTVGLMYVDKLSCYLLSWTLNKNMLRY